MRRTHGVGFLLAGLAGLGSAPLAAQTAADAPAAETASAPLPTIELATSPAPPPPAAAAEAAKPLLEEVIVSATRRAQSIDKIPVAVTEVDASRLEAGSIRDTRSLSMEAPSLNIAVSGSEISGANIRIRGIGTAGSNGGFESSVGVFVDGVYIPRPGLALNDLVDVERVEVLRGPQGTLFGKNTTVGAINIFTHKPEPYAEARLSGTLGDYGTRIAQAVLGGPVLDDTVSLRLAAQYNQQDGYIHNLYDGRDYNDRDRYVLRGQALFTPTPDASLRLIVDRIHKNEHCCATPFTRYGAVPAQQIEAQGGTVFDPPAEYSVAFNSTTFSKADEFGASLHGDWNLDFAQLRGIVAYRQGKSNEASDADKNDLDIVYIPFQQSLGRLGSAELSLHGEQDWLDWLFGAFYSQETIRSRSSVLFGEDAGEFLAGTLSGSTEAAALLGVPMQQLYAPGSGQTLTFAQQHGHSWSLFSHNVFQLGAGFDATLGVRYLRESKDGGGFSDSNSLSCNLPAGVTLPGVGSTNSLRQLCAAPPYQAQYDDSRVTGTAALGRHFDHGLYLYASASSGFKAGGINLNPPGTARYSLGGEQTINTTFQPERITAYELGAKAALFERRLSVSAALFYMDLKDFQISVFDGLSFVIGSGNVHAKGVELESRLALTQWLRLRAAATWADSVYASGTQNTALIGQPLTNSPRWAGQLGADLRAPLGIWDTEAFANLVARYQSAVNTGADLDPNKTQSGYTLINARAGLALPRRLELSLWGANLSNHFYRSVIFTAPSQAGSYAGSVGMPRAWGLDVRKSFF